MRVALVLALALFAPLAAAEADECGHERTEVAPVEGAPLGAYVETRDCEGGRSWEVALIDPDGRSTVSWYDDERGRGLEVFRPPRFVSWTQSDRGCEMVVYVFGAEEPGCVLGAPPAPPAVLL